MPLPYYPFWWSDYSGDTFSLTQGQHGAYFLLLRHIYAEGTPIPNDERYSIARAVLEEEKKNADYVLQKYFKQHGAHWVHTRAFEVIDEANEKHEKRVNAGAAGGKAKARASSNARDVLPATPKQSSTNQNQNQTSIAKAIEDKPAPKNPHTLRTLDGRFLNWDEYCDELWQIYPAVGRRKGNKKDFFKNIQKALTEGEDHEAIRAGVAQYASYCIATGEHNQDADRWASKKRWGDDYTFTPRSPADARAAQPSATERVMRGVLANRPPS